jgi:hypothetical protein
VSVCSFEFDALCTFFYIVVCEVFEFWGLASMGTDASPVS